MSGGTPTSKTSQSSTATDGLVDAIAKEITHFEGWKVGKESNGIRKDTPNNGSRSWRNHNPGNLRIPGSTMAGGYTLFNTDQEGLDALNNDIKAKFNKRPNSTF